MTDTSETRLAGLVVGSADPDRLADWYRAAFAPDSPPAEVAGSPLITVGDARLVFDRRDDVAAAPVEPGRMLINLYVGDMTAAVTHLEALDVRWIRPAERVAGLGSIATVTDADGNYVQLLQPAAPSDEHNSRSASVPT